MRYTLFGESHGAAVGLLIEGFPAGIEVDHAQLHREMERRMGGGSLHTARKEADEVKILSGVFEGYTTGDPVCLLIENRDVQSRDYAALRDTPRPSHADYAAFVRSGGHNDYRGGGHCSGRLTAPLVAAGSLAKTALSLRGITLGSHLKCVGGVEDLSFLDCPPTEALFAVLRKKTLPVLNERKGEEMQKCILAAKVEGDSCGGAAECAVLGIPAGAGGRNEDENLESALASALFAIPGVKSVSFGTGERFAMLRGSEANDAFCVENGAVRTKSNRSGGVNGGMSNGMPLIFTVTFRPTPSIVKPQQTVDLRSMEETEISVQGRHDPCIALRGLAAVEAAAALTLLKILPAGEGGIELLRRELDAADADLLAAFERRMAAARKIGKEKKIRGIPVRDAGREAEVLRSRCAMLAEEENSSAAKELMQTLMRLSREAQEEV